MLFLLEGRVIWSCVPGSLPVSLWRLCLHGVGDTSFIGPRERRLRPLRGFTRTGDLAPRKPAWLSGTDHFGPHSDRAGGPDPGRPGGIASQANGRPFSGRGSRPAEGAAEAHYGGPRKRAALGGPFPVVPYVVLQLVEGFSATRGGGSAPTGGRCWPGPASRCRPAAGSGTW